MSLPRPATAAGRAGLAAILAAPADAVVALDFDGTLAPIVPRPADARVLPGTVETLGRLARRVAAVVVVTGRPVSDVLELGGLDRAPGLDRLVVLGQYGVERYDAGTGELAAPEPSAAVTAARGRLPDLLRQLDLDPAEALEDKGHAVVVHTRRAADPDAALDRARQPLTDLAAELGLVAAPGRLVIELRPPGFDKGGALTRFVRERGAGAVLFAGDDLGDLPAYDAVEALRQAGVPGLTVCSDSPEVAGLRDRADLVVDGPPGVLALLGELAAALGG